MQSSLCVYWNGTWCSKEQALIPVSERALLFGDGLFTSIRVHEGIIEGWERHMKRLQSQAKELNLVDFPMIDPLQAQQLILRNHALTGTWRLKLILMADGEAKISLPKRAIKHIYMELIPYQVPQAPFCLGIYPEPISSPLCRVKSLAYLERLWLKQWAIEHGWDDVIVTHVNGALTEASTSALFWMSEPNQTFYYPSEELPRLKSIALEVLSEVALAKGMQVVPVQWRLDQVPKQVNWYLANALLPVWPVIKCGEIDCSLNSSGEEAIRKAYCNCWRR